MNISWEWIFIIADWLIWAKFAFNVTLRKFEDFIYQLDYGKIIWRLYDLSGLRAVWGMIFPPKDVAQSADYSKPSTFLLWIMGIYIALFGIASNRYENRVDLIDNRVNSIFAQLASQNWKNAFSRMDNVQKMTCPLKPEILKPVSVLRSFFVDTAHEPTIELLKETVEDWKDKLDGVDLRWIRLEGAALSGANFKGTNLSKANLRGVDLAMANLVNAVLKEANLMGANFVGTNFKGTNL